MFSRKSIIAVLTVWIVTFGTCFAGSLEQNWNDFLHYTLIGRLDLAKGYAQAILESRPDPVELLALSDQNPQGHQLLSRARQNKHDLELAELAGKLWEVIENGRFIRRSDPKVIVKEIQRLSTTQRGWFLGVKHLKGSGEYAIPFMLDALSDISRKQEWPNIVTALPEIGRGAIRPLVAALQTENVHVKDEIIKALGEIEYPQSLAYLKYVMEKEDSAQLRSRAGKRIRKINSAALKKSAAALFYNLAEDYYYHAESLASAEDAEFANIWFWDRQAQRLSREMVDKSYFNELMAMRSCEWALRADAGFGQAIGLWLAAYYKAESTNVQMPRYFGENHPDALTYATTAGPQYLHQALGRAVKDKNAYVALGVVEALAVNAGEKSLLYRLGTVQPLVQALFFKDRAVRYSAAIAIAEAGPTKMFPERKIVVQNLSEAIAQPTELRIEDTGTWNKELAHSYAVRAASVMLKLAQTRNRVIDLSAAQSTLVNATKSGQADIQILAGRVLAHLESPDAQRTIATMALEQSNGMDVRIAAFDSLAESAKLNANLLEAEKINAIYSLVGSPDAEPQLRSAAAAAYGALNLPSQKVKDLILDQAES